jgi:hypothetical protein
VIEVKDVVLAQDLVKVLDSRIWFSAVLLIFVVSWLWLAEVRKYVLEEGFSHCYKEKSNIAPTWISPT